MYAATRDGKLDVGRGAGAEYVTLLPGELARLPGGRRGAPARVVRALSGTVWLTHGGNDEILWPGETFLLEPQGAYDARRYGPVLAGTLGPHGAVLELQSSAPEDPSAGKGRGPRSWHTGHGARRQSRVTGPGEC